MLVGAALSKYLTPETSDANGRSRKLEDLAKGKAHRKEMEREDGGNGESRNKRQ